VIDLNLLTKDDLITGIISARSRSREEDEEEEGGDLARAASDSSEDEDGEAADSSRTRRAQRCELSSSPGGSKSKGPKGKKKGLSTGGEAQGSETDFANDAEGEETEAEPSREVHQEQRRQRKAQRAARGAPEPSEPVKRSRSRTTSVPGQSNPSELAARPLRGAAGRSSGYLSAGTSSPLFDNRTRQLRNKPPVFAASSPIRTRAKSRQRASRLSLGSHIPGNRTGMGGDIFMADATSRTPRPKRRATRGKRVAFENGSTSSRDGSHDEWVESSPVTSKAVKPLRQSKRNAQAKIQVDLSTGGAADAETTDVGDNEYKSDEDQHGEEEEDEEGGQSDTFMEEATPVKSKPARHLRRGKNGTQLLDFNKSSQRSSSSGSTLTEVDQGESTDTGASPSKIRKLRNGKLRLMTSDENMEEQARSSSPGPEDVEMADADQEEENPMSAPTNSSLNRLRRAELVDLCSERDIEYAESDKKADLINSLMNWFNNQRDADISSTATAGKSSIATVRGNSKRASRNSHKPLLLRSEELEVQSSKPSTPALSVNNAEAAAPAPGDGVDELNGLDLESLNLLDKEISPSKLEKLEKIGSGGFKDVYVGKYHISKTRVNKVAISDIRDHLTEMDIKEISLLRDLKHENIVRFIGVSIPDDPKNIVPCMIVSELCSNGDLFDYIRNVAPLDDEEIVSISML